MSLMHVWITGVSPMMTVVLIQPPVGEELAVWLDIVDYGCWYHDSSAAILDVIANIHLLTKILKEKILYLCRNDILSC